MADIGFGATCCMDIDLGKLDIGAALLRLSSEFQDLNHLNLLPFLPFPYYHACEPPSLKGRLSLAARRRLIENLH